MLIILLLSIWFESSVLVLYMYVINLCHVQCKRILHYKGEVTLKRYDKHKQPTLSNQSCFKWSRLCASNGLADTEKKSQIVIIISENKSLLLGSWVQLGLALKHTCRAIKCNQTLIELIYKLDGSRWNMID